jgi:biopolymer transport protein ExbB/TolQ
MSEAQIAWPLISVVGSLVGTVTAIIVAIVAVMKLNRRQPPLAEYLAKNYALRTDLDDEVKELNNRIDREIRLILAANIEQSKKLDALIATTGQTARDTDRSLGRIEGKIEGLQGALDQHIKEHHEH